MDSARQTTFEALKAPSRRERCVSLSLALAGTEPPSEFRIFTAGTVDTVKGSFTFDAEAASSVMAEYQAHGIDLMIDYDHASLSSSAADPALSGRAAGWFNLELRDGELWAVNVRWTPHAADALRAKEWRFMSPAFQTDEGRIVSVMNVAITNLPATRKLDPLMAASLTTMLGASTMDPKLISEALDALVAGDDAKCAELLKGIIASAAGGAAADPDADTEDAPPPVGDGGSDEAQEMGGAPPPPAADPSKKEDKTAVAAAISRLTRTTGKATIAEAVEEVDLWRASHVKLEAETKKLAAEREAIELGRRKDNAAKLVALGAETPHTSGLSSFVKGGKSKLAKRLLDEPLAEQNERVAALLAAKGGKVPAQPPPGGDGKVNVPGTSVTLTADQARICKETGCDPAVFASLTAQRDSVKSTGGI